VTELKVVVVVTENDAEDMVVEAEDVVVLVGRGCGGGDWQKDCTCDNRLEEQKYNYCVVYYS